MFNIKECEHCGQVVKEDQDVTVAHQTCNDSVWKLGQRHVRGCKHYRNRANQWMALSVVLIISDVVCWLWF